MQAGLRIAVAGVVCVLGLWGCAGERTVQKPVVRVEAVELERQTEEGVRVGVKLELENPNDVALPLTGVFYRVEVGGKAFAFGDRTDRTLPAGGRQRLVVAAALGGSWENVWRETVHVSGWVRYEPPGWWWRLLSESGVPHPAVGFEYRGPMRPCGE